MHILATKTGERAGTRTPLVTHVMQRYGASPGIPAEAVTRIMLALFQGLARQRQIDPAAVPADLFRQALQWLLIGMQTASLPEPPRDGRAAALKTEDLPVLASCAASGPSTTPSSSPTMEPPKAPAQ